jgi:ribosome-binding protein aMBF1 (putative translation factor)
MSKSNSRTSTRPIAEPKREPMAQGTTGAHSTRLKGARAAQEREGVKSAETTKAAVKTPRNKGLRFPAMHAALGDVLRTHRNQKNVSQADVSMDADVDRAYISRIERAEQSPTIATLIAIASRLGVPAWQLLKEAEERVAANKA